MYIEDLHWNSSYYNNRGYPLPVYPALTNPDSKIHGHNLGPIWGRQDQGGPHVDSMNFAIWELSLESFWQYNIST